MKAKLSIWVGLYLLSILMAYSQPKIHYRFGVTGGVNASQIKNERGLNSIRWRYNTGITMEQRFSPAIAIAYELVYSRQGENVNFGYYQNAATYFKERQNLIFDYLSLPIMVRIRPKGERVFLEAGGQLGYMLHNEFYLQSTPDQVVPIQHAQPLDLGLTGGVGYRLGKHLVVDARYYYGMKPILADFNEIDSSTGKLVHYTITKWYNRVYMLNLSYYF